MKYDAEYSVMRDTFYYISLAANFDYYVSFWEEHHLSTDIPQQRFEQIQQRIGKLPEWLIFLFLRGDNENVSFWREQSDHHNHTLSVDQVMSFAEDRNAFFEALAVYYIQDAEGYMKSRLINRDIDAWYRESERKKLPAMTRVQLLYLCDHYEVLLHEAREILIRIYQEVKNLHRNLEDTVQKTVKLLQDNDVQSKIEKYIANDIHTDEDIVLGIMLLNPYAFAYVDGNGNRVTEIVIGDYFEDTFVARERLEKDFRHFVVACGSEYKIKAVMLIMRNGSMTLTQLAEAMGTQPALIIRQILALVEGGVLCRERKEGRNVYYNLNADTFRSVKHSALEFWNRNF